MKAWCVFVTALIKASLHVSSTGIGTLEVEKEGSCYLILLSSTITTKKMETIRLVLEKKKDKRNDTTLFSHQNSLRPDVFIR